MLYVAGWGSGEEELREYVKSARLDERVRILGMVEHQKLPLYYSASDLVFIPVRWENLHEGSATAEAFACRRPVVAFRRHETDQTEQAGGFLIEDEPGRGAVTLIDRLRNDQYLEDKGREGAVLSKQFTMDHAAERLEEIYDHALNGGKRRKSGS